MAQLDQMDSALEQMVCYAEIFTDLATANQAMSRGKWMAEWLPRHYAARRDHGAGNYRQDES